MATCYRHPDRETGVSCSNCARPICPDCMTSTSVGMRCPECARERTKVLTARNLTRDPIVAYVLIAICVVVWLGELATGSGARGGGLVYVWGALYGPAVAEGQLWRLVSSGFLHSNQMPFGLLHIGFNMYILYFLGRMLEPSLGRLRFALLYFTSLLAGSLGALALTPTSPTVGASGAVFGLMAAGLVVSRARGIDPWQSGILPLLLLNLLLTFRPGISIGGHLGGMVGGAIAAYLLADWGERQRSPSIGAIACGAVAVLAAVAAVATVS
jgi:membrane associated rhomboid family serine protease